jgi:hypothetical protein
MAYNRFTIDSIRKEFGIEIVGNHLIFNDIHPISPSDLLSKFLERYLPLGSAIGTEKARSEFIIAPMLAEITEITEHRISLFSGTEFNVDEEKGLNGRCDFIISASGNQYALTAPVLTVVEAKNDNINAGFGQCMAEMIAARIFNEAEGNKRKAVYGSVTTGSVWRFLKLEGDRIYIDKKEYFIDSPEQILGILSQIVSDNF